MRRRGLGYRCRCEWCSRGRLRYERIAAAILREQLREAFEESE